MKAIIIYFFIGILSQFTVNAQQILVGKKGYNLDELNNEIWNLPKGEVKFFSQPVNDIEIIDARPDTNFLGFVKNTKLFKSTKGGTYKYLKINVAESLKDALKPRLLEATERSGQGFNILIAIREFWVYEDGDEEKDGRLNSDDVFSGILFKSDIYIKKKDNLYIPLTQFDTGYRIKKTMFSDNDKLFTFLLDDFYKKLNKFSLNFVLEKATRFKSRNAVDSLYSGLDYFSFIRKMDTSKNIAFKTIQDFKKNNYIPIANSNMNELNSIIYERQSDNQEVPVRPEVLYIHGQLFIKGKTNYQQAIISNQRIIVLATERLYYTFQRKDYLIDAIVNEINAEKRFYSKIHPVMLDINTGKMF